MSDNGMNAEQREKSLHMAMGQIERAYGKGAVMRLGAHGGRMNIAAIPTGSIALDIALGVGGFPRGRVVELFGPESSGKCVVADTYIWTDQGLETVAELFERCGQAASCTSRVTDISELGVRVVNERGELEPVSALTHNGRRPTLRLRLRSGRSVTVTHNHPLRVVDESGFIVWRTAENIRQGDFMVSARFGAIESASGDDLSEDEAVLLGYLVAEGSLSYETSIRFTNHDPEVADEFSRLMEGLFGATVRHYEAKEHVVFSKALRGELKERYGLEYVRAEGKTVPHRVRTASHKIQRAFLSALFEGDGWIDGTSTIGLASASEQLVREVQLLLYGFGIPATVSSKFNGEYERDYWTVTINPAVAHRFLEEIGFRSARRRAQVETNFRRSPRDPQFENIPHLRGLLTTLRDDCGGDRAFDRLAGDLFRNGMDLACSSTRLARIVRWIEEREGPLPATSRAMVGYLRSLADAPYTFEKVDEIEDGGERPTFDLVVPGTHSFVANGVLSHNSTLALHVVAEAQKLGGVAAFIDAEHAIDPVYSKNLGVDIDALLVSQPDTGEQALEIADMLIRSGAIDIIVVDSVAALVPRAEIEGEMGDTHVGLQARLMSQAMRKLTASVSKSRTCVVFINQIREKVGVLFGCFSWDTQVVLADGSVERIGKIVNQRMLVEVLSYDPERGEIAPKRVVNWFDNGPTDEFLQFTVARPGRAGRSCFGCTENHQIRTPSGWREARELNVGDRVLHLVPRLLSEFQWEIVLGALMGDGALSENQNGLAARLRFGHGKRQAEYCDWKAALFENIHTCRSTNAKGAVFHDLPPLSELNELRKAVYIGGKKVFSEDYLKRLTPLALAIWYMDDATFQIRSKGVQARTAGGSGRAEICVQAMELGTRERLVRYLADTWGIGSKLIEREGKAVLKFPTQETAKLQALIAPYVHPSMEYKLLPRFRGRFGVKPEFSPPEHDVVPMEIKEIHPKPPCTRTHRYDIEVEGSHNYFADGVMVHNSPETTPGGRALKFYSSVRLDVRRVEGIKDGQEHIGNRVRAKVVKNKVSPPFKTCELDLIFNKGISKEGSLIDVAVDLDIVTKSGAWYQYEGDQIGQGRENAKIFLVENPEAAEEIERRIKAEFFPNGDAEEAAEEAEGEDAEGEDAEGEDAEGEDAEDEGAEEPIETKS